MQGTIEISLDDLKNLPIDSSRRDTRAMPKETKPGCDGCYLYSFCVNELGIDPYSPNSCYMTEEDLESVIPSKN